MIIKRGSKWLLMSKDGKKKLGEFKSKKAAVERERQIMFFKSKKK